LVTQGLSGRGDITAGTVDLLTYQKHRLNHLNILHCLLDYNKISILPHAKICRKSQSFICVRVYVPFNGNPSALRLV